MTYFATFFSHFGATRYKLLCDGQGISCRVMPVPRDLSSSCGTCVFFKTEALEDAASLQTPELEQIVRERENGYEVLYTAAE